MKRNIFETIIHYLGHGLVIGLLCYLFYGIAKYLYGIRPTIGIDLYLSVSFISYIYNHLNWPFATWFSSWYGGGPLSDFYPSLSFYLSLPLIPFVGVVRSAQVISLVSLGLLGVFSYFLYYEISKNKVLAAMLAIGVIFSFNIYLGWIWTGAQPYTITQFSLPLTLFLVFKGLNQNRFKFIWLAGLILGFMIYIHPQTVFSYTIPYSLIVIALYSGKDLRLFSLKKIKLAAFFVGISYLVALPEVTRLGGTTFSTFVQFLQIFQKGGETIARTQALTETGLKGEQATFFNKFRETWERSNPILLDLAIILFVLAIFFIFLQLLTNRKILAGSIFRLLTIAVIMVYFFLFVYGFWLGINPLTGGWPRAFWTAPIILGLIASGSFSVINNFIESIWNWALSRQQKLVYLKYFFALFFTLFLAGISYFFLGTNFINSSDQNLKKALHLGFEPSSAYPSILAEQIDKDQWPAQLPQMTPSWLDPNNQAYRLADLDATVNIWWASLFDMPQSRGYLDAPSSANNPNYPGWQYFANIAIWKDELVDRFEYTTERARNVALFFLDWNGVKYLEGSVGLATAVYRNYGAFPSSYISDEASLKRKEEVGFPILRGKEEVLIEKGLIHEAQNKGQEGLFFYELQDQLTSPIYMASDAPSILVISNPGGQDVITRLLAGYNLNSKRAIIVQGNQFMDEYSPDDLRNFDLIILYQYKYKNSSKVWKNLLKYVSEGGKVFVDIGSEVAESDSEPLPEVFPVNSTDRESVGEDWNLNIASHSATQGIDFTQFLPPKSDSVWNYSFPVSNELRLDSIPLVWLNGKPIVVEYSIGSGKILYSGFNLPYYVLNDKGENQLKFFENLIFYLNDFTKNYDFESRFDRPKPEKAIIFGTNQKGLVFKESYHPAWKARLESRMGTANLKVYQAGPGMMYAFVPEKYRENYKATFTFKGDNLTKIKYIFSFGMFLFLMDLIILNGLGRKFLVKVTSPITKPFSNWWEKEEEQ